MPCAVLLPSPNVTHAACPRLHYSEMSLLTSPSVLAEHRTCSQERQGHFYHSAELGSMASFPMPLMFMKAICQTTVKLLFPKPPQHKPFTIPPLNANYYW